MYIEKNNDCMPIVIGDTEQISRVFAILCGDDQLLYEAIISPLPTITINAAQFSEANITCQAVLVIQKGNGDCIEEKLTALDRDGFSGISLIVQDVRRIYVRCDEVPGGVGCRGFINFTVQYCECINSCFLKKGKETFLKWEKHDDECCSCSEGKAVLVGGKNQMLTSGFNLQCGTKTGTLFMNDSNCTVTVSIIPFLIFLSQQQCIATLLIELDDGCTIQREITPPFVPELGNSSPPAFTIANVKKVRLCCSGGEGENCSGSIIFVVSYC